MKQRIVPLLAAALALTVMLAGSPPRRRRSTPCPRAWTQRPS